MEKNNVMFMTLMSPFMAVIAMPFIAFVIVFSIMIPFVFIMMTLMLDFVPFIAVMATVFVFTLIAIIMMPVSFMLTGIGSSEH